MVDPTVLTVSLNNVVGVNVLGDPQNLREIHGVLKKKKNPQIQKKNK